MQDLKLLGVHDDEEHLLLVDDAGERYTLPIDESLYAAVRRDRAHLGQLQAKQDPARPRDIQAKIRAGLTAEEVSEAAGVPLEQVHRYEGPVLAERAHIAERAGKVLVYPAQDPTADGRPLAELAAERLRLRDVDLETTSWDAWRRPDSRWYVELAFTAAGKPRTASWTFDRGTITPEDDEARWLTDAGPVDSGPLPPKRLAAVADSTDPGGGDTDRLLDTLNSRRGKRTPVDVNNDDDSDPVRGLFDDRQDSSAGTTHLAAAVDPSERADEIADEPESSVWPLGAHTAASAPDEADSPEILAAPEESDASDNADRADQTDGDSAGSSVSSGAEESKQADGQIPGQQSLLEEEKPPPSASKRHKRHSVPSWDEIMFGAKRD